VSGVDAVLSEGMTHQVLEIQYLCGCQASADGTMVHVCVPHLRAVCARSGIKQVVEPEDDPRLPSEPDS
jgi:hypothetical protein